MIRKRKIMFGTLLLATIGVSACSVALYMAYSNLNDEYQRLLDDYGNLNTKYLKLKEIHYGLMNETHCLYKKMWTILAHNVTLRHRDTLVINLLIQDANEHWGVDGIDRIEVNFINVYSPELIKGQVGTGKIKQYFDGRRLGDHLISFPSQKSFYRVSMPISPSETKVREFSSSISFWYENWNYIRVDRWMKIEFHYLANMTNGGYPSLSFEELELYVVGFEKTKLGESSKINPSWICYRMEMYVVPPEEKS